VRGTATDELKKKYDLKGFTNEEGPSSCLWFDLELTEFYAKWKGKLIVGFPPPERAFWQRAHKNNFSCLCNSRRQRVESPNPGLEGEGVRLR